MFKIEITKLDNSVEHIYNMNSVEDNFLQFVPKQFGVPPENMKAFMIEDENQPELEAYLKLGPNYALDVGESGKIKVVTIETSENETTGAEEIVTTLVKEYIGTEIQYPYDSKGRFLGNGFEL
ncbi:MAG: hypothetical protein ACTSRU_02085 [Candidatus Hodarchaeales archaeon]